MPEDEHVSELAQQNEELRAEVESLKTSRSRAGRQRLRRIVTAILVVLTSISVVATTAGVWMNRTIWNTDRFVALVAPLSDNRAVTDGLAVKLAEDTFQALDVQERVRQALASIPQLPEGADALLAGPLTTSAQSLIEDKVKEFLASPAFDRLWIELNRRVHEKVVALLDGNLDELPNVSINDGQVQLNMLSVLADILQEVAQDGADALGLNVTVPDIPPDLATSDAINRLGSALGVTLPADFGQLTIMSETQLNDYQSAAGNLQKLSGALFVLSCLLFVLRDRCLTLQAPHPDLAGRRRRRRSLPRRRLDQTTPAAPARCHHRSQRRRGRQAGVRGGHGGTSAGGLRGVARGGGRGSDRLPRRLTAVGAAGT